MQKKQLSLIILLMILLISSMALLGTQIANRFIHSSGEVTIKSNSIGGVSKTWEFSAENALPGDSESKEYNISLSLERDTSLLFRPEVKNDENGAVGALLLRVENTANGKVICEGKLSELLGHDYAENFTKQDKSVTYKITVTVDPAAGNEYQNKKTELRFTWSLADDTVKEGDR